MKKSTLICAALSTVVLFTACKSKESAYKQAYEHAKQNEVVTAAEETPVVQTPVVTPMVQTPVTQTTVVTTPENVRTEDLSVIDGAALRSYSVVVGSFGVKANAEGLARTLRSGGYDARIAYNSARNMYRVVASSFDSQADAVASRNSLREKYPDAWLLYQR